jgi:hypothetical protein
MLGASHRMPHLAKRSGTLDSDRIMLLKQSGINLWAKQILISRGAVLPREIIRQLSDQLTKSVAKIFVQSGFFRSERPSTVLQFQLQKMSSTSKEPPR